MDCLLPNWQNPEGCNKWPWHWPWSNIWPHDLAFGIPQGSVHDPILFTLYTLPLSKICRKHHMIYHLYVDDTQVYLTFKLNRKGSEEECIQNLENCISDIRDWMYINLLKCDDKTEFFIIGTQQQLQKIDHINICVGEDLISPVNMVHNFGFFMEEYLKNKDHMNRITSSTYNTLRKVHQSRLCLDIDTTKIIVQALVLSKLDYCNSLLLGSPEYKLDKLQGIQKMACRVIFWLRKHDHITNHLKSLHWWKIRERIAYKIASIIHECKNNQERLPRSSRTEYINSKTSVKTHISSDHPSLLQVQESETHYHWIQNRKMQQHLQ